MSILELIGLIIMAALGLPIYVVLLALYFVTGDWTDAGKIASDATLYRPAAASAICWLIVLGLINLKTVARVIHYFFVPHPAEQAFSRDGTPTDMRVLVNSLGRKVSRLMPVFVYENMQRKADALTAQRRAETALLRQAIEEEKTRAELEDERR